MDFLKCVKPLFNPGDYVIFDKYTNGGIVEYKDYKKNFHERNALERTILHFAISKKRQNGPTKRIIPT